VRVTSTAAPVVAALLVAALLAAPPAAAPARAQAAWPDSLLLDAPDFAALRGDLLPLTAPEVAVTAWSLVPRLVVLGRPDLLVEFLQFWEDRCGASEPITRTRILAAIWDGAFDEGLYDESLGRELWEWESRDPSLLSEGRAVFDDFTISFADQLLPHQQEGSLPEYFCLMYSDRAQEAATALADDRLAETWARWYVEHPDGADGGEIIPADADEAAGGGAEAGKPGPASLLLTVGGWWPRGGAALAGSHVLVGGLLEQRVGAWFVRLPVEVRLGRTDRPYRVDHGAVRGESDRFDAVYFGGEAGRTVFSAAGVDLEAFAGLGFDGLRPFRGEDLVLATLNGNLGLGLRWRVPGTPLRLGADARREWLGPRNEGVDSLSGSAWSLRFGLGPRFGPGSGSR
jgi:hypothetical protein